MKTISEITREEFDTFKAHKKKFEYTLDEANTLVNLTRTYVNSGAPSCLTCGDSLRKTKTMANEWLITNTDKIEAILLEREKPIQVEPVPHIYQKNNNSNKKK